MKRVEAAPAAPSGIGTSAKGTVKGRWHRIAMSVHAQSTADHQHRVPSQSAPGQTLPYSQVRRLYAQAYMYIVHVHANIRPFLHCKQPGVRLGWPCRAVPCHAMLCCACHACVPGVPFVLCVCMRACID